MVKRAKKADKPMAMAVDNLKVAVKKVAADNLGPDQTGSLKKVADNPKVMDLVGNSCQPVDLWRVDYRWLEMVNLVADTG